MKLHFLGTRGGITARSRTHYQQSSLLLSYKNSSLVIDWGEDWRTRKLPQQSKAVLITHAHKDHMGGITDNFPLAVYATQDTWNVHKIVSAQAHVIVPREPFSLGLFHVEAFAVHHSLNAPAVGYRITAGKRTLFYVSDLTNIIDAREALSEVDLYIGDGAIITRTLLKRVKENTPVGHSPIVEQLSWCAQYEVPRAIFTHCGTEITLGNHDELSMHVKKLGRKVGVNARIATDDMEMSL